ncbi:hypothetical protein HDU96_006967 [Phlyctochytrium bullatum]|nr:hypothetical protein HDU96_006967 [Phlyctochytrium bullatum]
MPNAGLYFFRYIYPTPVDLVFFEALKTFTGEIALPGPRARFCLRFARSLENMPNGRGTYFARVVSYLRRYAKRLAILAFVWALSHVPVLRGLVSISWRDIRVLEFPLRMEARSMGLWLWNIVAFRALGRELVEPYICRSKMDMFQRRQWFHHHEAIITGFTLPFYFLLEIPILGPALFFGLSQASAARLSLELFSDLDVVDGGPREHQYPAIQMEDMMSVSEPKPAAGGGDRLAQFGAMGSEARVGESYGSASTNSQAQLPAGSVVRQAAEVLDGWFLGVLRRKPAKKKAEMRELKTPTAPASLPPSSTSTNARRRSTLNSTVGAPAVSKQNAQPQRARRPSNGATTVTSAGSSRPPLSKPGSAYSTRNASVYTSFANEREFLDGAGDEAAANQDETSSVSVSDLIEFKTPKGKTVYFETQQIMPAPGQTYFQLVIEEGGNVILRDWPRQRLSQKWTRNGYLNPGSTSMTVSEFLDGEMKEKLVWIFGEKVYEEAVNAAIKCVQEESAKMRGRSGASGKSQI